MTARAVAAAASLLALTVSACTNFYEVPIETPIQPKMDVSAFQRVLIAGFLAGGSEDVDANLETVRLLRSQLRIEVGPARDRRRRAAAAGTGCRATYRASPRRRRPPTATAPGGPERHQRHQRSGPRDAAAAVPAAAAQPPAGDGQTPRIKDEKDLEPLETIFANVDYWKKIGEEFQNPLIVTGSVLFTPHARSGFVQREQEYYDTLGRRRVVPVRTYMERKGFILRPKFIFIDGRTGATLYSETFREEILYSPQQSTPALSSYFELMDRLVPEFPEHLEQPENPGIPGSSEITGFRVRPEFRVRVPGFARFRRRPPV